MSGREERGLVAYVPNALSAARIPLSLSLLFVRPLSLQFIVLYILCGLTDALDGFAARTLHAESKFGAKLDSVADFTFFVVALSLFIEVFAVPLFLLAWAFAIIFVRFVGLMFAYGRFHSWAALHTSALRIVAFTFFCFPLLCMMFGVEFAGGLLCGIGTLGTLEEIYINAHADTLDVNVRGAFELHNNGLLGGK